MQAAETIRETRRFSITTLSLEFPDVSRSVVYKIVNEDLNLKKVCSRWVPRLFRMEHKEKRFAISLDFLIIYEGKESCGSPVVKVLDRGLPCHEFEPRATKVPPCRAAIHVNLLRAETSSRWCGVVVRRGGASSSVVPVT
ncbi:hypothetical protein TNCV_2460821 [Trichonephila clavipes]|nr:hypothetical protein TNCV_2460821 [Trichonephila clavipes]